MKKKNTVLTLFIFCTGIYISFSQEKTCNCITDLNQVAQEIKEAKSYEIQLKKRRHRKEFEAWKEVVKQEILNDSLSSFFCAGYLQKYIGFIKDKHNFIYTIPDDLSAAIPNYTQVIDTTHIKSDGVSGIYYAGNDKILLTEVSPNIWYGVTLASQSEQWTRGKIRLRLQKLPSGTFELFEFYQNGMLYYQTDITLTNGRISGTFWNKQNRYYFNLNHENNFTYKPLNDTFDYIAIKSFNRDSSLLKEANTFYANIIPKLHKENLIIDLRNNAYGRYITAKPLYNYLNRKILPKIYVLVNFQTAEQAEQLTNYAKKHNEASIAGETTRGMFNFGYHREVYSNTTKCYGFLIKLTSSKSEGYYLDYKDIGITPDIKLDNNSDWIEQIINLDKGL